MESLQCEFYARTGKYQYTPLNLFIYYPSNYKIKRCSYNRFEKIEDELYNSIYMILYNQLTVELGWSIETYSFLKMYLVQ